MPFSETLHSLPAATICSCYKEVSRSSVAIRSTSTWRLSRRKIKACHSHRILLQHSRSDLGDSPGIERQKHRLKRHGFSSASYAGANTELELHNRLLRSLEESDSPSLGGDGYYPTDGPYSSFGIPLPSRTAERAWRRSVRFYKAR